MKSLMRKLYQLQYFEDNKKYHPEKNVLDHSFQCYFQAKKEHHNKCLHVAALFHDLGKILRDDSSKKSPDHEKYSISLMIESGYSNSIVFELILNHMRMHKYLNGEMKKVGKTKKLTLNPFFYLMVILARCDSMSRKPDCVIPQRKDIEEEIITLLKDTNEYK